MDVSTHIRTFTTVVRAGSFSEAARHLGVAPSVVGKRIAQLEEALQTRLFERTTRRVSPTEAGEKFYSRAVSVVTEMEDLLDSIRRDDGKPEGHLKVMAPTTVTMRQLGPVFSDFLAKHPRITLTLALVDLSANPAESGFDMAISGRASNYEGVVDIPLCPVRPVLCASPEFLAKVANPTHPRELTKVDCLVFTATGSTWTMHGSKGSMAIEVKTRLQADDNLTLLHAAKAGLGIAQLPTYVVESAMKAGELRLVMPDFTPQENWFKAYIPRRNMRLARVQALLEHLQGHWAAEQQRDKEKGKPYGLPSRMRRSAEAE